MEKPKLRKRNQPQKNLNRRKRQQNNIFYQCSLFLFFLYNSGEYFYRLFSKCKFFSSLIVETHFFMKQQIHLETDFITSHIFTFPEQLRLL
ncbi:hypothetical protein J4Q44_G00071530 [Coregonus suidteri]|uniref:Uncharacterized protein n=1 Tax=Coregonus suidteri TaxID=861788 RepID=A0AAN8MBI0_9TELE